MQGLNGTNETIVIKLGGAVFSADAGHVVDDLQAISQSGVRIVVVHGGGNSIDAALSKAGIQPQKVNGVRVTNAETLAVVIQVLDAANCFLAGTLPQADPFPSAMSVLRAMKAQTEGVDLGFVGEIIAVDTDPLFVSLSKGKIPVVAPIAYDHSGCALNVNADHAAATIASALGASWLLLLSDVAGVLAPGGIVTPGIDKETCKTMIEAGTITGGMIPKTQTAIDAVESGVENVVIADGLSRHAVRECLRRRRGTLIRR
ncbi:MAG TPA: acetylglutamate kinase [Candidatus Obscuribacterales bacterium]